MILIERGLLLIPPPSRSAINKLLPSTSLCTLVGTSFLNFASQLRLPAKLELSVPFASDVVPRQELKHPGTATHTRVAYAHRRCGYFDNQTLREPRDVTTRDPDWNHVQPARPDTLSGWCQFLRHHPSWLPSQPDSLKLLELHAFRQWDYI